jgi:hypothetical protein
MGAVDVDTAGLSAAGDIPDPFRLRPATTEEPRRCSDESATELLLSGADTETRLVVPPSFKTTSWLSSEMLRLVGSLFVAIAAL